jgi:AcrR family transcriptional regulator
MEYFMKSTAKMSGKERHEAIITAARRIFIEKGFHRTTTRELADAAGVSEALVFKHFPSKEALYSAIEMSCLKEDKSKIGELMCSLTPSTKTLVFLVHDLIKHVLGDPQEEDKRVFISLILRSLMDEGEYAKLAIRGGPSMWVKKVGKCLDAAKVSGDIAESLVPNHLSAWMAHLLITGILIHMLPTAEVVDYGVSKKELIKQATWFCLRGMGMKETAIRSHYKPDCDYSF